MALPLDAAVRSLNSPRLGRIVRGPVKASRGMQWVLWEDRDEPVLMNRPLLTYVARHFQTAVEWRESRFPISGPPTTY